MAAQEAALVASVELAHRVVAEYLEEEAAVVHRAVAEARRKSATRLSLFNLRHILPRQAMRKCPRHRCKGHIPDLCHQYHRSPS